MQNRGIRLKNKPETVVALVKERKREGEGILWIRDTANTKVNTERKHFPVLNDFVYMSSFKMHVGYSRRKLVKTSLFFHE